MKTIECLSRRNFVIFGLVFKPNADDMREASSRVLMSELFLRGYAVDVYDPIAMVEAVPTIAYDFIYSPGALSHILFFGMQVDALQNANALLIAP